MSTDIKEVGYNCKNTAFEVGSRGNFKLFKSPIFKAADKACKIEIALSIAASEYTRTCFLINSFFVHYYHVIPFVVPNQPRPGTTRHSSRPRDCWSYREINGKKYGLSEG